MFTNYHHVCFSDQIYKILATGIQPGHPSIWHGSLTQEPMGEDGWIYAFSHHPDSLVWAEYQWIQFDRPTSIVTFRVDQWTNEWEPDLGEGDPLLEVLGTHKTQQAVLPVDLVAYTNFFTRPRQWQESETTKQNTQPSRPSGGSAVPFVTRQGVRWLES